ncbi:hypothetical protein [Brachyspira catarrhinii]|uniref:Uncharacterized protein n=1 Tax=Brachyspira catarrhinii TaxID=2528966 RepID=A0ABY2TR99_9SPIR|nr:hypothetical protein [Brachyspira catarrhinii]TKZ30183.1 hypothetical protein EZH24_10570 [Brachyspira catarrhinii]
MKKLLFLFILLINSILFSFEIPDNIKMIHSGYNTYYVLVTEDYYFNIVNEFDNISLYLSIKTPETSYTNNNYDTILLKKFDESIVLISNLSTIDKTIDIISKYKYYKLLDNIYNINDNKNNYKVTYFKKIEKYSDISALHKSLTKFIDGSNIDIIFTNEYKSENILKVDYKSFCKDLLTILDLYKNIMIDSLY